MGPHTLAAKFHVAVSSPLKVSRSRRVFSSSRETGIRASTVQLCNPQGVRGVNSRDLRLFLESANTEDFRQILPSGIFYGVTINPFLLKEANKICDFGELKTCARCAIDQGVTEVHIQTWGEGESEMIRNGQGLVNNKNCDCDIVIKVPCTVDGLKVAKKLVKQNTSVAMTGLCSVHQVLLAIGVGATYAVPYLGRMDAVGKTGVDDIKKMQSIITATKSDMKLLVASINCVQQVTDLAACGVSSFALKKEVLVQQILSDPHTEQLARELLLETYPS